MKLLVGGELVDAAARNIVSSEKLLHWVVDLLVGRTINAVLSEPQPSAIHGEVERKIVGCGLGVSGRDGQGRAGKIAGGDG